MSLKKGVHGLDLLAYRHRGDVKALMRKVCSATKKPVIIAGSIDTRSQLGDIKAVGATGFTIGTAALNGSYVSGNDTLQSQLKSILKDVAVINGHTSNDEKDLELTSHPIARYDKNIE
ncbi:hypothetical protein ACH42_15285 [Endozoicomonas sp. (ex Bugula neritina AB1)]|nr:hypothetical protein ACH42_15285 [Endozoicomonas sp. (ex Bugula neritina AB1)]